MSTKASKLNQMATPGSAPTWRRLLHSRLFPYLVILPAGAAIIVAIALLVFDSGPSRGFGIDPADFPIEWSLRSLIEPEPGEIPASAVEIPAAHAFIRVLADGPDDRFQPWAEYVFERDLIGGQGWTDADDRVTSISIFPGTDEGRAQEAFFSLVQAVLAEDGASILKFTTPGGALEDNFVREFEVIPHAIIGDNSVAYRLRHGTDDRRSEAGTQQEIIRGFDVDVTAYWVRIGGAILLVARNEPLGINVPRSVPIDLEALARSAADRVAAFDPATDILPELLEAQ